MMGYYGFGRGMMGYGGGWIMMIGLVFLIVIGVIVFYRLSQRSNQYGMKSQVNSALSILDERYAKGEISDEEYKNKKMNIK